jgi:nascent polypeptide-associated complex subunit alpha
MPSVAEELAQLRRSSLAKNHAAKFQNANGLSTPELQKNALKTSTEQTRASNYTKEAVKTLNAGTKAVDQDLDFKAQQTAHKKEEQKKRRESTIQNNAGTKAVDKHLDFEVQKMAQKKEEQKKQKEATQSNNAGTKAAHQSFEGKQSALTMEDQQKLKEATKNLEDNETKVVLGEEKKVEIDEVPEVKEEEQPSKNEARETMPEVEDVPDIADDQPMPNPEPPMATTTLPKLQNRAEKKARKFMQKLCMTPVPGISRVTLKLGGKQGYFTIYEPDVYKKNGSYVVFGEAKQGSAMPQMQQQQAQAVQKLETPVGEPTPVEPVEVQDAEVDESGVDPKDIELVISQAGCSRAKAVAALKENSGDLVNAIMSLTA